MQRKKTFLVVCISLVIIGRASSQSFPSGIALTRLPAYGTLFSGLRNISGTPGSYFSPHPQGVVFSPTGADNRMQVRPSLQALEDDYYTHHFGFMCKKELQLEKTTHIPLRFRLGSLEQCNYLEGKR